MDGVDEHEARNVLRIRDRSRPTLARWRKSLAPVEPCASRRSTADDLRHDREPGTRVDTESAFQDHCRAATPLALDPQSVPPTSISFASVAGVGELPELVIGGETSGSGRDPGDAAQATSNIAPSQASQTSHAALLTCRRPVTTAPFAPTWAKDDDRDARQYLGAAQARRRRRRTPAHPARGRSPLMTQHRPGMVTPTRPSISAVSAYGTCPSI